MHFLRGASLFARGLWPGLPARRLGEKPPGHCRAMGRAAQAFSTLMAVAMAAACSAAMPTSTVA